MEKINSTYIINEDYVNDDRILLIDVCKNINKLRKDSTISLIIEDELK